MTVNPSFRWSSLPLALLVLIQSFLSVPMYALSGGPTQPEFGQPATVGADNMVDLFTGNFQYSIPLFEIGGYPMTLSYSSDHKMEEEASWVGFGWTLNPGVISRQVRGLPDDFRGDEVVHRSSMRDNITTGISVGADVEVFGTFGLQGALNFNLNNYNGFSFSQDYSPSVNVVQLLSGPFTKPPTETTNSGEGGLKMVWPWQVQSSRATHMLSANFSSRAGLQSVSWGGSIGSQLGGLSFNTGGVNYTPTSSLPQKLSAKTFHVKAGGYPFWSLSVAGTYRAHSLVQSLATNSLTEPAYGYLYLDGVADRPNAIMDYNVEQGGLVNADATRLPIPYGTPDIFAVTGPGISGQIEVTRNRTLPFRPASSTSTTVSIGLGGDVSAGTGIHLGANLNASGVVSTKAGWEDSNPLYAIERGRIIQETQEAYLRFISDPSVHINRSAYTAAGEVNPVYADIKGTLDGMEVKSAKYVRDRGLGYVSNIPNGSLSTNLKPASQGTVVNYLTAREAKFAALNRSLTVYRKLANGADYLDLRTEVANWDRTSVEDGREDHHISEISVLSTAGQRYVYGLPVYNQLKQEVTFNAAEIATTAGGQGEDDYGLVSYENNASLISINNSSGRDQLFDEVITAPHPVAHLLTSVLSPDYTDVSDDGLTPDDLGNYVKIGYSSVVASAGQKPSHLGYRTPLGEYTAVLSQGNLADELDDKASFSYGTKEVYYVHHMDSKTHRAIFFTSDRKDAVPVDRDGKLSGLSLQKLDRVEIYTLAELARADEDGRSPVAVKKVHLEYMERGGTGEVSTELPNARDSKGKLTLASVHFTYGKNNRGSKNKYQFSYKTHVQPDEGDAAKVPYAPFMMDRWGTRKHQNSNPDLAPLLYPYATQDLDIAEEFCDLGNLTHIGLPSGGMIDVEYEPDDYAYVQNYRGGKMYTLAAVSHDPLSSLPSSNQGNQLYASDAGLGEANLYAYVKVGQLPDSYNAEQWRADQIREYLLSSIDLLYFSALVDISSEKTERITGYADFDKEFARVFKQNNDYYLVLKLIGLSKKNRETNRERAIQPITFAALDKLQFELPWLLYGETYEEEEVKPASLLPKIKELGASMQNYYKWRLNKNIADAQTFDPAASYVKLSDPLYKKLGGGSRVKQIKLDDRWLGEGDEEVEGASMQYTKTYDYTVLDEATQLTISSGVAANEPLNGKEELLYVNVGKFHHPKFLTANTTTYMENPAGLSLFPSPSVGYGSVTERMYIDDKRYHQSKPGTTVHTFNTAKDFPVRVALTEMDRPRYQTAPVNLPFVSLFLSRLGLSQGVAIETNDMHGKPRAVREYGADGYPVSSTVYNYATSGEANESFLNNEVNVVKVNRSSDGESTEVKVGKEFLNQQTSIWMEMTADQTSSLGGGVQVNGEVTPPFLYAFPTYPNINRSVSSMHTSAITKLTHRSGILKSVIVTNNGSSLETENLRFDELTGTPLLTRTQNEFDDYTYQLTNPAYLMDRHQGMGPAYVNTGCRLDDIESIEEGQLQGDYFVDHQSLLLPGDELVVYKIEEDGTSEESFKYYGIPYVGFITLVDATGKRANLSSEDGISYRGIIKRSGNRNLLTALAEQTLALTFPNARGGLSYTTQAESPVINTTVAVYSQDWGNLCGPPPPYSRECEDLASRVTASPVQYIRNGSNPPCKVEAPNWRAQITKLKDCNLCEELFNQFAADGWISNVRDYGTCDKQPNNTIIITPQTDVQRESINDCSFLNQKIFTGEQVYISHIFATNSLSCKPREYSTTQDCEPSGEGGPPGSGGNPYSSPNGTFSASAFESSQAVTMQSSVSQEETACFPWNPSSSTNPYLDGQRGNWRVKASYVPKQTDRSFTGADAGTPKADPEDDNNYLQPLLFEDGTLMNYHPFWSNSTASDDYIRANVVKRYDEHGHELETENALNIPSGAQYGFYQNLPVAVAQNARHTDIGFDGFEDYNYDRAGKNSGWLRHFGMLGRQIDNEAFASVVSEASHTGQYAFKTTRSTDALAASFEVLQCDTTLEASCPEDDACSICNNGFLPKRKKRYLASVWAANSSSLQYGQLPKTDSEVTFTVSADLTTSSSHYRSNEPDTVQVDELIVQSVHGLDGYDPEDRTGGIPQLHARFEFSE